MRAPVRGWPGARLFREQFRFPVLAPIDHDRALEMDVEGAQNVP
jgi:hypothetical protein